MTNKTNPPAESLTWKHPAPFASPSLVGGESYTLTAKIGEVFPPPASAEQTEREGAFVEFAYLQTDLRGQHFLRWKYDGEDQGTFEPLYRRKSPAVADDRVTVPREPTEEMLVAGQEAWAKRRFAMPRCALEDCTEANAVYKAMLAAAPAQHDAKEVG